MPGFACGRCGMPDLRVDVSQILDIHQRCKAYHVLPFAGSLMEQPAAFMDIFDAIEGAVARVRREQQDDAKREAVKQEKLGGRL